MRAVVQRVSSASVAVDGTVIAEIGSGLLALVGVTHGDDEQCADRLADKLWNLRVFEDDAGRANLSAADLSRPLLVVSQFTLYADTARGRRPSFVAAAEPGTARPLLERLVESLRSAGAVVEQGRFGARMALDSTNDGPFTVILDAD